jgi:hypothetical protein
MASRNLLAYDQSGPSAWKQDYQLVLSEADKTILFERVEVAEAAMRTRLNFLESKSERRAEREELEQALARVGFIKRYRLGFC